MNGFSVASTGIEPVSGASETLILSIVLRGLVMFEVADIKRNSSLLKLLYQSRGIGCKDLDGNSQQNYAKKFSYRH